MLDRTSADRGLSEEQRMMRQSCRDFVDDVVFRSSGRTGSANGRWCRKTGCRREILEEAEKIGIRTLGVPEEFGGVELEKGTEVQTFALIAEEIARGDSGPRRQAGAELEGLGAAAQSRAPASAGEMVHAPRRRPAVPDGALPDRAARRLRPLAALQRAGSGDADARPSRRTAAGSSTAASSSSPTAMTPAFMSSTPTPTRKSACCRARRRFWCRATPRAFRSRAATRRSAAAS